ncbi:hypothetical protein [Crenobacter cavernae]|uniref:hypothetical protein n=1 Tax=Crenobacter cavernae TaxID=2290923 RepID=UPI0011C0562C|nr:hypothetical protein [Crenobacter cavernae]
MVHQLVAGRGVEKPSLRQGLVGAGVLTALILTGPGGGYYRGLNAIFCLQTVTLYTIAFFSQSKGID